jgi:hypothetical protein
MPLESLRLSLDAQNCNWNVMRTLEESILICTWSFGVEEHVGVIGRLNHTNLDRYGGGAVVSFFLERITTGARPKTSNKCASLLLDTLQSMSVSAPLSLGLECCLYGVRETGFLSVVELDNCMNHLHFRGSTCRKLWTKSSVAGIRVWDTSTVFLSSPPPTAIAESDGVVG